MGWISNRFHTSGRAKWGKPVSEEKRRAPLRKIVRVIRMRESMFDSDYVELDCGHTANAFGDLRARCLKCSEEKSGEQR